MVKISDKTNYSRFVRPSDEDEGIWLDYVEVHLVTNPVGQVKEMHVHDPPQDHVITVRSGQMRWTVEGEALDAGPGGRDRHARRHPAQLLGPGRRASACRLRRLTGAPDVRLGGGRQAVEANRSSAGGSRTPTDRPDGPRSRR